MQLVSTWSRSRPPKDSLRSPEGQGPIEKRSTKTRISKKAIVLRLARQIHLYVGLFISPALMFFALTGFIQTLDLHETRAGNDYRPPAWVLPLAQMHKKQTLVVPEENSQARLRPVPQPSHSASRHIRFPAEPHLPMKLFFLTVSLGLCTSTITGIYMAFKYSRSKVLVIGSLAAGLALPMLLMWF